MRETQVLPQMHVMELLREGKQLSHNYCLWEIRKAVN